ncbi:MAG: prepilin-type N-terminal cleavage/methylation domain-containing protein [Candidatus Pacebacteria bacterium]|nr:prepilin-type N-terminal cleavage/methylation domain-containing protein [Candidatus Paceibacterota bacterium]
MKKNKIKFNKGSIRNATHNVAGGFTLVETLVAISIFTIALIGMLNITGGTISDTNYAKDKLVANYLASEGIEYIRNLRDTYNLYEANGWDGFLSHIKVCKVENKTGCYINPRNIDFNNQTQPMKSLEVNECAGGVCPNLYYEPDLAIYKYNYISGNLTSFSRKIFIEELPTQNLQDKEIKVTSTVSFVAGRRSSSVTFTTYLKNWNEF